MLKDLAALTPPLVVATAFLIATGALLRREMGSRRKRDRQATDDISAKDTIQPQLRHEEASQTDADGEPG